MAKSPVSHEPVLLPFTMFHLPSAGGRSHLTETVGGFTIDAGLVAAPIGTGVLT